ncbi:MAG: hypothetical protein RIT02_120, partial [Planctomycetota bacterium]
RESGNCNISKENNTPQPGATYESGEGGIRTLGTVAGTPVFETGTFGRSVTSPEMSHRDLFDITP